MRRRRMPGRSVPPDHPGEGTASATVSSAESSVPTSPKCCIRYLLKFCTGSAYNLKAKLDLISRLRQQAGLPEDVFFIYPELGLHRWQEEAIEAVTEAAEDPSRRDGRLGIVSMPRGA